MSHDDAAHEALTADQDEVLRANRDFYDAFERRDLDLMSVLWVHDDRATCVHPGWTALRGWAAIGSSWAALFNGPQHLQFIVTEEHVVVEGDVAWVNCVENLLADDGSACIAALNMFIRRDGDWAMIGHHGAPVMAVPDLDR